MRRIRAYCPSCDAEGRLGQACGNPLCRSRRVHFIPSDHYRAFRDRPAALRDARIGQRLGDSLLVERRSRGAFGQLYIGSQLPLQMTVAVKVFDPLPSRNGDSSGADDGRIVRREDLADMFHREARALSALSHPNIVRLLAFDGEHEPPYLVMEYVDGARTLRDVVDSLQREGRRRLSPRRAGNILRQILFALSEAHARGVVHLDLRPDNIGVQRPAGYDDFVRVLDFGLATQLDSDEDETLGFGTPAYIAPERISGRPASPAADLYAVGVMAFELLVGNSPFGDRDPDDIVAAKRDPSFDPCETLVSSDEPSHSRYPQLVVDFFRAALARDPDERQGESDRFLARLEPVIDFFAGDLT